MIDTKKIKYENYNNVERLDINPLAYIDLKAGDIIDMDFGSTPYSPLCGEQVGNRPVLVLVNVKGVSKQQLIPVVKLTSKPKKRCSWHIKTQVEGMRESYILIEQFGSFSRDRITSKVRGHVSEDVLQQVLASIAKYMGIEVR